MDAFDVLQVPANSDKETCKQAYRKLASQHHPDKGGNTATFQKIQKAWDDIESGYRRFIRKDPGNTSAFGDMFSHRTHQTSQKSPRASSFSDIFNNFHAANSFWNSERAEIINVRPLQTRSEFVRDGHVFTLPPGLPDGFTKSFEGRPELVGNSGGILRTFKLKINVPHDTTMQIQGIDTTAGRLPFTVNIGDAICSINTHAMNLIVGAWVQISDVFNVKHSIRIPEGFNPQHRLRIAGAGYYHWDADAREPILNSRGDLFVEVVPTFSKWDDMNETDRSHATKTLKEKMNVDVQ